MGARASWALALALGAVACSPGRVSLPGNDSLYLMNQTHDAHELAQFRARELDCVEAARAPADALPAARFDFERCVTLQPAGVVSLDREPRPKTPPACEAVALEGPDLAPLALFWTDTAYDYWNRRTSEDALLALVSVDRALVLEPARNAVVVPLDMVPEDPCDWAP